VTIFYVVLFVFLCTRTFGTFLVLTKFALRIFIVLLLLVVLSAFVTNKNDFWHRLMTCNMRVKVHVIHGENATNK